MREKPRDKERIQHIFDAIQINKKQLVHKSKIKIIKKYAPKH